MNRISVQNISTQVCQIRVMSDFNIVTLTQDGDFDFKTITVFLFFFDREPFFLAGDFFSQAEVALKVLLLQSWQCCK